MGNIVVFGAGGLLGDILDCALVLGHRIAFSTVAITLKEAPRKEQLMPAASYSTGKELSGATRSSDIASRRV